MKSLKDYSLNLSDSDYHSFPAWSYSVIAKYAKDGFGALATLHEKSESTPSMDFGSLFDSIMTKGKKTLEEYTVVDVSVPDAEKKVLDTLATSYSCPFSDISVDAVLSATEATGYYPRWKAETKYEHVSAYSKYFDIIRSGKKLVSEDDWNDAMEMYKAFRDNEYLNKIFGTKNTKDIEYIYQSQFVVKWVIEGEEVSIKIMPDLLVVNHSDKTIQPVDLKTSAMPAYAFSDNFIKFRYDIQAELYTDVLNKLIYTTATEYSNYTILPYLFTDISRTDKIPVTYMYDPTQGLSFNRGDKTYQYKGWKELLAEILVYEANNAKVPNYITTDGPNDLINILSR